MGPLRKNDDRVSHKSHSTCIEVPPRKNIVGGKVLLLLLYFIMPNFLQHQSPKWLHRNMQNDQQDVVPSQVAEAHKLNIFFLTASCRFHCSSLQTSQHRCHHRMPFQTQLVHALPPTVLRCHHDGSQEQFPAATLGSSHPGIGETVDSQMILLLIHSTTCMRLPSNPTNANIF